MTLNTEGFSQLLQLMSPVEEENQDPDRFIANSCVLFWFVRTFQGTICKLLKD